MLVEHRRLVFPDNSQFYNSIKSKLMNSVRKYWQPGNLLDRTKNKIR